MKKLFFISLMVSTDIYLYLHSRCHMWNKVTRNFKTFSPPPSRQRYNNKSKKTHELNTESNGKNLLIAYYNSNVNSLISGSHEKVMHIYSNLFKHIRFFSGYQLLTKKALKFLTLYYTSKDQSSLSVIILL